MAKKRLKEKIDPFTRKRLEKFVTDWRARTGQLPTLNDLAEHSFERGLVECAVKEKFLEELYVTLTNGAVVKGYKVKAV